MKLRRRRPPAGIMCSPNSRSESGWHGGSTAGRPWRQPEAPPLQSGLGQAIRNVFCHAASSFHAVSRAEKRKTFHQSESRKVLASVPLMTRHLRSPRSCKPPRCRDAQLGSVSWCRPNGSGILFGGKYPPGLPCPRIRNSAPWPTACCGLPARPPRQSTSFLHGCPMAQGWELTRRLPLF